MLENISTVQWISFAAALFAGLAAGVFIYHLFLTK